MQVKLKIYSHAKDMDIKNYDDQIIIMIFRCRLMKWKKSIERLINTIKNLTEEVLLVLYVVECCMFFNDKLSMLFIVISFIGCFTIDLITTKINFKIAISRNHHEKKTRILQAYLFI